MVVRPNHNAMDQQRGWATEIQKDLKWFAKFETGESPKVIKMFQQADQVTNNRWKTRAKTAAQASFLMQATEDDLAQFE